MPDFSSFSRSTFSEGDVRHLASSAAFARGDALQREGHVLAGDVEGLTLQGSVRGTWSRVYQVAVAQQNGRFSATCSCSRPGVCQHAVSLLLESLRQPHRFRDDPISARRPQTPSADAGPRAPDFSPRGLSDWSPASMTTELTASLELLSLAQLRDVARARGISHSRAKNKGDLIALLAPALISPDRIAAAADLDREERLALDAAYLVATRTPSTTVALTEAYRALGGKLGTAPLEALTSRALVLPAPTAGYQSGTYILPRVVSASLPRWDTLPGATPSSAASGPDQSAQEPPTTPSVPIAVDDLLLIVLYAIRRGVVGLSAVSSPEQNGPSSLELAGNFDEVEDDEDWDDDEEEDGDEEEDDDEDEDDDGFFLGDAGNKTVEFLKGAGLSVGEIDRLVTETGHSRSAIIFAVEVLQTLGVVEGTKQLVIRDDAWRELNTLPSTRRLAALAQGWLRDTGWAELALAGERSWWGLAPETPLEGIVMTILAGLPMLRAIVAQLLGRLPPGRWHRVSEVVDLIGKFRNVPQAGLANRMALVRESTRDGYVRQSFVRISEDVIPDRHRTIIEAMLAGPLSWLGLVDLSPANDRPQRFAVRPAAGILGYRAIDLPEVSAPSLTISPDLVVQVPPGADSTTHSWLARAGELLEAGSAGARYRLAPASVATLFEAGITGPQLAEFLAERSATPLPAEARATLDRWWTSFGSLRLYDEISLLELGDSHLLAELLATTSLRSALVHAFSPQLVAVQSGQLARVIDELTRLGYTPRVVEEA
jgi:Helicase conserved C-terminal domain